MKLMYGWIETSDDACFDLNGMTFNRYTRVFSSSRCDLIEENVPMHELANALASREIVSIGEEDIGDEAHVLVQDDSRSIELASVDEVKRYFRLS